MLYRVQVGFTNILVSEQSREKWKPSLDNSLALGAVTTRYVTADTERNACDLAIALALEELHRSDYVGPLANGPLNPPVSEILEVDIVEGVDPSIGTGKGFVFYTDEESAKGT